MNIKYAVSIPDDEKKLNVYFHASLEFCHSKTSENDLFEYMDL